MHFQFSRSLRSRWLVWSIKKIGVEALLCPLEDRRGQGRSREGMLEGFSLGSYLLLVDYITEINTTPSLSEDACP